MRRRLLFGLKMENKLNFSLSGCAAIRDSHNPSLPRGETFASIWLRGPIFVILIVFTSSSHSGRTIGTATCWSRINAGSPCPGMCLTGDKFLTLLFLMLTCYRKNTYGGGAPEQWMTQQAQFEPKVMALNIIRGRAFEQRFYYCAIIASTGSGAVFGPYFIRNQPFNADEYLRLLRDEVFPDIHDYLGDGRWRQVTWMQV